MLTKNNFINTRIKTKIPLLEYTHMFRSCFLKIKYSFNHFDIFYENIKNT